jgi:predicted phage terminase large subunit-like protein
MEWMNDPTPEENATFKHFTYFDKRDLPTLLNIECFVDVGGGSVKKGADDTAITITGTDQDNVMYVIDYFSEQTGTNTDTIIDEMFRLDNLYHPKRFLIEKSQAANFLVSPLEKRQLNDRHFLNIEYVSPPKGSGDRRGNMSDGKYQRIAAMASPFKLGAIRIQKWMTKLIDQATRFPRATHDDVLDATAYSWMFSQKNMRPWEQRTPSITDDLFGPEPSQEYEPLYADIGV